MLWAQHHCQEVKEPFLATFRFLGRLNAVAAKYLAATSRRSVTRGNMSGSSRKVQIS